MPKQSKAGTAPGPSSPLKLNLTVPEPLAAFLRGQALCYGVPVETLAAVAVREWIEERRRTIPTIQMVR